MDYPLITSCKDCIFCTYDDNMVQVGCLQNKIEKIKDKKFKIEIEKTEDKEIFVIKDHICNTHRKQSFLKDLTIDEAIIKAKKDSGIKLGCFVMIDFFDEEKIKRTLDSIVFQSRQFHEVVFCINNSIKISQVLKIINNKMESDGLEEFPFKWVIKSIIDDSYSGMLAVNLSWNSSQCTFFSCFKFGFIIPKEFSEEINFALTESLEKFLLLDGIDSDENGLTIQTYIFNLLKGNEEGVAEDGTFVKTISEKIEFVAKDQNLLSMIKKCGEICPSMSQK